MKKIAIAFCVSLALTGCASSVTKVGKFEGVTNHDKNKGAIFVYRESSFVGAVNQYDVLMNDELVGSLPNGSFFTVNSDAGSKFIKADTSPFGKGSSLNVEAGKSYCMKMTLNFCLSCKSADIDPVGVEQCEREMSSLSKVVLN